jgi:hypothetical protein
MTVTLLKARASLFTSKVPVAHMHIITISCRPPTKIRQS